MTLSMTLSKFHLISCMNAYLFVANRQEIVAGVAIAMAIAPNHVHMTSGVAKYSSTMTSIAKMMIAESLRNTNCIRLEILGKSLKRKVQQEGERTLTNLSIKRCWVPSSSVINIWLHSRHLRT
jgi:hypothetical protein